MKKAETKKTYTRAEMTAYIRELEDRCKAEHSGGWKPQTHKMTYTNGRNQFDER